MSEMHAYDESRDKWAVSFNDNSVSEIAIDPEGELGQLYTEIPD
jgi:hypothetical protein